ncbi:XRE family transcriptional regulator [Brevibacillus choshinensis]|uniref:XRE family transcriptional regulator n=1 Tax=Brevibacillus choshinensis TaxID=54911 RepID=A0ABX7FQN1_BRECH|nr:XRE family transcriptional regulator [Brevibacillus choshinensis]QRG68563.1 XRE family transcriptional regulator [Brevibacillus choshinensis]
MSPNQYGQQLGQALMEAGITQLSFSFDAHVSPESVSAYKNGRAVAPPDVKSKSILITDNPFLAMAAADESTAGTSPGIMDGDRIEVNRHTVLDRTEHEMLELLKVIQRAEERIISAPPRSLTPQERQEIETLIQETLDVVTASTNLAAILCREYKVSWIKQWAIHKSKWMRNGLMKMMKEVSGK